MQVSRKGFVHSIKVPRLYKDASVIVKKVVEEGGSLKDLLYNTRHKNLKGIYALVVETIKHAKELDKLIKVTKLLRKENRLQPWLARVLITELIYGKKNLKGESKPVQTVLSYKKQFEKLLLEEKFIKSSEATECDKSVSEKMDNSGNALFVFLMYSAAMLILPLATFFAVKNLLEKEFHILGFANTAWSVICAVIVVNLIIMAYAWRAYKQAVQEDVQGPEDVHLKMEKKELDLKKDD